MAETELEALNEISGKLTETNEELDLITLELIDVNTELDNINIFIDDQEILNAEISDFMEHKSAVDTNIQYQLDTSIQLKSYDFIFIGLIIGILLISLVTRLWRNV
ncbi:MAG: hypothetical protein K8R58_14035 [Bacteroidales bacterium]|nr:hypothetical protein [Bacteroidales bacterium]